MITLNTPSGDVGLLPDPSLPFDCAEVLTSAGPITIALRLETIPAVVRYVQDCANYGCRVSAIRFRPEVYALLATDFSGAFGTAPVAPTAVASCECGAASVGSGIHSSWCPKEAR